MLMGSEAGASHQLGTARAMHEILCDYALRCWCADGSMSICTCWQLLQSTTSGAADGRGSQEDLISGAQEYLERGHVAYMQRAIQAERAQVPQAPLLAEGGTSTQRMQRAT